MAVTITTTNPQPTWLRAGGYEWANQVGTWAAPAPVTIVELDSTHSLNVSEDNTTNFLKSLVETLGTVDSLSTTADFLKGFADSFTTADSLNTTTSFLKDFADSFTTVDSLNTTTNFLKDFAETLGTVDSLNTTISFLRGFAEGLAVAESFGNHTAKPFADSFTTVSALGPFSFTKSIFETLTTLSPQTWRDNSDDTWATQPGTWASNFYYPGGEVHFDSTIEYLRGFTEGVAITESFGNHPNKSFRETLRTTESLNRIVEFLKDFAETLDNEVILGHDVTIPIDEALVSIEESLFEKHMEQHMLEYLKVIEVLSKSSSKPLTESFNIFSANITGAGYFREMKETLLVADTVSEWLKQYIFETLTAISSTTTGYRGTISDMLILNEPVDSFEDFKEMVLNSRVSGFSDFKSYIQGDYTYDKAMVKAVLESTSVSGRTELENMEIQVDLPDIIERGTATILVDTDGIAVTFNKSFWITPELTVTVKGGDNTVALIPEITQQSSAGFTVKLRNADTGAYAIGTLSWTAHGY